eukprot:scaffold11113_cov18-Tisochrysis_lutea.AAC.4
MPPVHRGECMEAALTHTVECGRAAACPLSSYIASLPLAGACGTDPTIRKWAWISCVTHEAAAAPKHCHYHLLLHQSTAIVCVQQHSILF